jgi:hypothetical protein
MEWQVYGTLKNLHLAGAHLIDDQCARHICVTFAATGIEIGPRWRGKDNPQGLSGAESGRVIGRPRWRCLSSVRQDWAVELMDFPAGVVDREPERR